MTTQTLAQFIRKNNIRASVEWADANPNMPDWSDANHFKVTLRAGRHQMTVPFSMGYAHSDEPTAVDVLDCLASDAASIENARSFEDWADELGYDPDSRKAYSTYTTVQKQADQLKRLLGDEAYRALLWDVERL